MTVITLSRQLGSHGEEVASRLAEKLGLRLVDAKIINRAAAQAGVPEIALAELESEGERSLADQVLKALQAMPTLSPVGDWGAAPSDFPGLLFPFTGIFSPTVRPISSSLDSYVRMVDLVVRGLAQKDDVLIVGRGGQVLLRKHPGAIHVQIVAPLEHRIQVLMKRHGLDKRTARQRIRASDRARFDYIRRYHDADWLDPTLYHLVLNTGRVPVAAAVELIVTTAQAVESAGAAP